MFDFSTSVESLVLEDKGSQSIKKEKMSLEI